MSNPAHIVRSIFTLGIAQILGWIGSAALAVLLPRYLGDVDLGKFTFAIAFTSLIGLISDLGAYTYLTKELAREPSSGGKLILNLLVTRIPLSLIGGAAAVIVANLAGYDPLTKSLIYVMAMAILVNALSGVVFGSLQGLQQMKVLAVNAVLSKLGYAGLVAVLLLGGGGAFEVVMGSLTISIVGLIVGTIVLLRRVKFKLDIDPTIWWTLLRAGLPFFVWQAALLVYGQIDMVMLQSLTNDAVVGWYAAAYRIVMIPVFVPTIVVTVIFPALSAASSDEPAFNAIARRAVHAVSVVSIPLALGTMLISDKVIPLLGYPATFSNSILPLSLLAPHIPLAAIDVIIGTVLNTRNRQRQWAMTAVAAAVLNPLANLVAVPLTQSMFGNGAVGAAMVTTLTEVFMMVVGLRLLPRGVFDHGTVMGLGRCVAAGAAMAAAVLVTRDLPLVIPVLLGGLVYACASLVSGSVSVGDLRQIQLHLIQRRAASSA